MEKHAYTAEEVKKIEEQLQEKGIKNGDNKKIELMLCLRYGTPKSVTNCIVHHIEKLTDIQMVDICTCMLMDMDHETIKKMCSNPELIGTYKKEYFDNMYAPERQKIYKEVFDEFHIQWQSNFEQLMKQTDLLSQYLGFMQDQIDKKDEEIKQLKAEQMISLSTERFREKGIKTVEEPREIKEEIVELRLPKPLKPEKSVKEAIGEKVKDLFFKDPEPDKYLFKLFAKLDEDQMEVILDGYEKGLPISEIRKYAKREYSAKKMLEMKKLLLKSVTKLNQSDPNEPR